MPLVSSISPYIMAKNRFRVKLEKIEASDFRKVSCTRGHESSRKLKRLIFARFHVPGVMKVRENWRVWFLPIFMYPGSWKLKLLIFVNFHVPGVMKIEASDFCEVSCKKVTIWLKNCFWPWNRAKLKKLRALLLVQLLKLATWGHFQDSNDLIETCTNNPDCHPFEVTASKFNINHHSTFWWV